MEGFEGAGAEWASQKFLGYGTLGKIPESFMVDPDNPYPLN